jgi:hypothetical protein
VPVEETVEVLVGVIVCVAAERVPDGVFVPVILGLPLTVPVLEPLVDGVPETLRVGDTVPVELTVPERLIVGELDDVGVFVAAERVAVTVFVPDTDGDADTVAEAVSLTVPDALPELDALPEGVTVLVTDTDIVAEALGVGVAGKQIDGRALSIGPVKE